MTIRGFTTSSSVPPLPSFSERDSRDSLYLTARDERQHRSRGDPFAPPATALPALPESLHRGSRTAAPSRPRRPASANLGAPWSLSPLPKDLYRLTSLAGSRRTVHTALPAAG